MSAKSYRGKSGGDTLVCRDWQPPEKLKKATRIGIGDGGRMTTTDLVLMQDSC